MSKPRHISDSTAGSHNQTRRLRDAAAGSRPQGLSSLLPLLEISIEICTFETRFISRAKLVTYSKNRPNFGGHIIKRVLGAPPYHRSRSTRGPCTQWSFQKDIGCTTLLQKPFYEGVRAPDGHFKRILGAAPCTRSRSTRGPCTGWAF